MIKKILDWIYGRNTSKVEPVEYVAPYKVDAAETVPAEVAVVAVESEVKPVVEELPVIVKAKYKKAELNKMTKKELFDLAAQHGVEVKARAPKAELVKVLSRL